MNTITARDGATIYYKDLGRCEGSGRIRGGITWRQGGDFKEVFER